MPPSAGRTHPVSFRCLRRVSRERIRPPEAAGAGAEKSCCLSSWLNDQSAKSAGHDQRNQAGSRRRRPVLCSRSSSRTARPAALGPVGHRRRQDVAADIVEYVNPVRQAAFSFSPRSRLCSRPSAKAEFVPSRLHTFSGPPAIPTAGRQCAPTVHHAAYGPQAADTSTPHPASVRPVQQPPPRPSAHAQYSYSVLTGAASGSSFRKSMAPVPARILPAVEQTASAGAKSGCRDSTTCATVRPGHDITGDFSA